MIDGLTDEDDFDQGTTEGWVRGIRTARRCDPSGKSLFGARANGWGMSALACEFDLLPASAGHCTRCVPDWQSMAAARWAILPAARPRS